MSRLEKVGKAIGKDATAGNELAVDVMFYYNMWYKCPGDPAAQAFTEEALEKWENAQSA